MKKFVTKILKIAARREARIKNMPVGPLETFFKKKYLEADPKERQEILVRLSNEV